MNVLLESSIACLFLEGVTQQCSILNTFRDLLGKSIGPKSQPVFLNRNMDPIQGQGLEFFVCIF